MGEHKVETTTENRHATETRLSRTGRVRRFFHSCFSTRRSRALSAVLLASTLLALALPVINVHIIYPAFTDIIVRGIEQDARRLGRHILPPALKGSRLSPRSLTDAFFGNIYKLENDFGLMKVKVFSAEGEVLYSTDPKEVGTLNAKPYFKEVVAKGRSHTKLVTKNASSLEGQPIKVDVVETYAPIMQRDNFLGAFEMYYDVTDRIDQLEKLTIYSRIAMASLSFCLMLSVIYLIRKEAAHQRARDRADALMEEVNRITQHDLKTPILSLLSGITYLEEFTELNKDQADIASDMREAANKAMDMINRSLELYKMETGKYEYSPKEMDLLAVIRRVTADLGGVAASSYVKLLVTRSGEVPDANATFPVTAEEPLCYSLFANLVKNGIEASAPGDTVTVALKRNDNIRVTVHNCGTVPQDVRDRFFDKYTTSGKSGGTGLGTYSALLMARTMGGTITMTTSEEKGTKLAVTLPLAPKTDN